ncbi:MAG TPA: SRPBCC family protein [Nocardioides sp.]
MSTFEVSRSVNVVADPQQIHRLIDDFREWQRWSPWEGVDPSMKRDYSGAKTGQGARYAWVGNRRAGAGSMEITASTPDRIDVALAFQKPFRATNQVRFDLKPVASGTEVTWTMEGNQRFPMSLFARFFPMDKMIGKDFEKGLAQLKQAAEQPA